MSHMNLEHLPVYREGAGGQGLAGRGMSLPGPSPKPPRPPQGSAIWGRPAAGALALTRRSLPWRLHCSGLLDHLVGGCEERFRHIEAECFCGHEIDHQLEFGGLQDWQIGRLGALEDVAGIDADLTISVCDVGSSRAIARGG